MPCIFCGSETDLTREHVFPAFMGGELSVPDGSCKRCNGEFGRWEAELRDNTRFLLNLLQIENRDGESADSQRRGRNSGYERQGPVRHEGARWKRKLV